MGEFINIFLLESDTQFHFAFGGFREHRQTCSFVAYEPTLGHELFIRIAPGNFADQFLTFTLISGFSRADHWYHDIGHLVTLKEAGGFRVIERD